MKIDLRPVWLMLLIILFYSCEGDLTPDKPYSQGLIFFSLLEPGKPVMASVSKSIYVLDEDTDSAYIEDIVVLLYENNILVDTMQRVDSFYHVSKVIAKTGNRYKFEASSEEGYFIVTDEVEVLSPPAIQSIQIDTISRDPDTKQHYIEITSCFDTIDGFEYIAYSTYAYESGKKGHRWSTDDQYSCSGDEIVQLGEDFVAYIGCLTPITCIKQYTLNYRYDRIDSVRFRICKLPDFTGDFLNVASLSGFGIVAPDDNIPSNVNGGYGAVLSISCTEKVIKLK